MTTLRPIFAVALLGIAGACSNGTTADGSSGEQMGAGGGGASAPAPTDCSRQEDCDDGLACTDDVCLVGGVCRNDPKSDRCDQGTVCLPGQGCVAPQGCSSPADCDDGIECTDDLCGVDGACSHIPESGRCEAGQVCSPALGCSAAASCSGDAECDDGFFCNGTESCNPELACVAGMPVSCDDGDPCTDDLCDEASRGCVNTPRAECSGGVVDGTFDITPNVSFSCQAVGIPLIDLSSATVGFAVTGGQLTVTGLGPSLSGAAPQAMSFSVSGLVAGNCNESYSLSGAFTDADHFTATFEVSLSGLTCDLAECTPSMPYSLEVTGTRRGS